ncbi:MAG: 3-deoxy-D-manno-octulosonic acid transferase [Candidatus Obscuribacterales bacterium]|nr:3-deoxy-D-manno-octulosonic acid transferase [Candidatus Obscuribacterales bacterium]
MIWVYYLFVVLVLAVAGPFLLIQKKARAGLKEKFGLIPQSVKARNNEGCIWIHAVSVGEFNAVKPLIRALRSRYPEQPIAVSTTTLTGQTLARQHLASDITVFYFPFDLPWATRSWLKILEPKLVIIAETEIWPGFVTECKSLGVKIITVNGRMSPKSARGYERWKFLFGPILRKLDHVAVQSENEAARYRSVGGEGLPVTITGNLKLDGIATADGSDRDAMTKLVNNDSENEFLVVAGSTHEGEESALLKCQRQLLDDFKRRGEKGLRPRLILAPRHPERFERVVQIVEENGFKPKRYSSNEGLEADNDVYILDGLGILARLYSIANVAFVGGTIAKVGGHNLLEPYAYSVPTLCGPHVHKTRDIARALTEIGALVLIEDEDHLAERLKGFLLRPQTAQVLGNKGRQWINDNQGAVDKTIVVIDKLIDDNGKTPERLVKTGASQNV